MGLGVCIATTLRAPGRAMALGFVRWHLAVGFDHIYLFWDDPHEVVPRELRRSRVTHIACDAALRRRQRREALYPEYGPHLGREVMARQVLNVESAIARARADGMRWLLHLDVDELWHAGRDDAQAHFRAIDASPFDGVRFLNLEAVPERTEIGDCFREVTLFKVNQAVAPPGRLPFLAYINGKAAVRLVRGVLPHGVHAFTRDGTIVPSVVAADPAILHYVSCGYRQWRDKYRLLGKFEDRWFGRYPIEIDFHLASRDLIVSGDEAAARAFYRQRVVMRDRAETRRLVEAGVLRRITGPRDVLARWR